jgi:uncharacterized protein
MKKTLVVGASPNPGRYSYQAVISLRKHGHEAVPLGIKKGAVDGITIINGQPPIEDIDTITLYLNANNQKPLYDYFFSLNPKRIIFNPGAENAELAREAQKRGVEPVEACTLVMLSIGNY